MLSYCIKRAQVKGVSPFQEGLVQETLMQETAGSLFPGLAGLLISLQLTHTVRHLGMAAPETHTPPKVGIPMQHRAGSRTHRPVGHLTSHHLTYLNMVLHKLEQIPRGRHNSQVRQLTEGHTVITHMPHYSETRATDNNYTSSVELYSSALLLACAVGFVNPYELIEQHLWLLNALDRLFAMSSAVTCLQLVAAFVQVLLSGSAGVRLIYRMLFITWCVLGFTS